MSSEIILSASNNAAATALASSLSASNFILAPLAPSTPDLTAATDTGVSNTDSITSDTTPTFTGTGTVGDTVTLFDGSAAIGSGVVGAGGTYTITSSALSNGAHSIAAEQTDAFGDTSALSGALAVTIDTVAPTVSSITTSGSGINNNGTGDLDAGHTVTFTVNFSETVEVDTTGGKPSFLLNDGGTATYSGGSGTSSLTFTYTVANGQNVSDLALTNAGIVLDGGTIQDIAGNNAVLTASQNSNPPGTLQIDTAAPTANSITTSGAGITSGAGDLDAGHTVTFTVAMSEAVNVTGTPELVLNDGGIAAYQSGSGTGTLIFTYTVGANQNTSDLAVNSFTLNGGTVNDLAGNSASLTNGSNTIVVGGTTYNGTTPYNPAGTLQIDTTAPTVSSIATSGTGITNGAGDLDAGHTVTFTVNFSETVNVSTSGGTPYLALNDGGTASYQSGTGTSALTFTYTVANGQNTSDLALNSTGIVLNGGTIQDPAGNNAVLTAAQNYNPPGTLQIDTTPPTLTVSGISPDTGASSSDGITDVATVTVSGTIDAADSNLLITVKDDGVFVATTTAVNGNWSLAGVTLTNGAHNLTATATDAAGNVGTSTAFTATLDTTAPTVSSITTSGTGITSGSGDIDAGHTVTFTVNFSEAVNVNTSGGTPSFALNDGGTATYSGGSGTSSLTFTYTVANGQNVSDLALTSAGLLLHGGTIQDIAGNNAVLTASQNFNPPGTLQIDTTAPTVSSIATSGTGITSGAGDLDAGHTVTFTVNFSETVNVSTSGGTPYLALNDGGTASYQSGTGTSALAFTYTVANGQNTSDLALNSTGIVLNGGTIQDPAGNNAVLTAAQNYNPSGALQIDTTAPTVSIAMSDFALKIGDTSNVTITFSEVVTGFSNVDVSAPSGTLSTLTSSDGGVTWKGTFTPSPNIQDETNAITVTANSYTNSAGNQGNGATGPNYAVNTAAPVIGVPSGTQAVALGTQAPITGVNVSEGSGNVTGETFTVTLSDSHGTLSATDGSWVSATHTLTLSGLSLSTLNNDLATLKDTDSTSGSDTITINATDSFGNAAAQQAIAVNAANPTPPAGFIFTPDAATLATLEQDGGDLDGSTQIGTFTESGGNAGDTYIFSIAGGNTTVGNGHSDEFSVSARTNSKSLFTGDDDVSGSSGGKLYTFTVTVTDTTNNTHTSALPFDVVVGNQNGSTITVSGSTPTVVYGLDGNDTINASGMTANTWLVGGSGADTMTGGSATNTYVFAGGDSQLSVNGFFGSNTISGYDVITNFKAGQTASSSENVVLNNVSVATGTVPTNSSLELHTGFAITSDNNSNGIVTFNDTHGDTAEGLTSLSDVAAAVNFLQNNDIGTTGSTVAFIATINGEVQTFVYTQGSNAGQFGSPDNLLIDLQGVSATALSASGNNLSVIDTAAPTVTSLTDVTSNGTALDANQTVTFTLDANENVYAAGASLKLSNGATAVYTSGSGSNELTFTYTVASGDTNTSDLKVAGYNGTLTDSAGNALVSSGVSEDTGVRIDTVSPNAPTNLHFVGGSTVGWNTATDNSGGSGIAGYLYQVDSGNQTSPTGAFTSTTGTTGTWSNPSQSQSWTLFVESEDNAGNVSSPVSFRFSAPAGTAGAPINLALGNTASAGGSPVAVTISGVPSGWSLNEGEYLGNGTWATQSEDLSQLAVTTAAAFAGAMLLNVTETWTNADGTTGTAFIADNVEAYAPGAPIYALAGDDNLTGAGGNDIFVFAQPIGNDTIYSFNVASDTIDLTGFASVGSYGDLHIADNASGDAVITLGSGEAITLVGVDASALSASDFVFDQTPVTVNHATMTVSDGAALPLSGTIDNIGTIALDSTGDQTVLQIVGDGLTLDGGGQVTMSGDATIVGTGPSDVLTNVDNTISGSGQIGMGDGNLTLVNEAHGVINADVSCAALILDTGHAIVNAGLLEASNGGLLKVDDAVSGGAADIAGGTMAFQAQSNVAVAFDNGPSGTAYGKLQLDDPAGFTGSVSGFAGTDAAHSDVVDLDGVDFNSAQFAETYHAATGVLSVTDGTHSADITFDNFHGALDFASDGNGGTDITDAPATSAPAAEGTLSFADNDTATNLSVGVTPEGQSYVGNLTAGTVTESNGTASVDYGFSLGNDQIGVAAGQTVTQSYEVSLNDAQNPAANMTQTVAVTIGGAGNDSFVFTPGVGADTVLNFNPQQDTIELDHFTNVQTAQELQSLITTDVHGDAVINLGNHDSVTLADTTSAQLQQAIQAGHVLLH